MRKPSDVRDSSTSKTGGVVPERRIFPYVLALAIITTLLSMVSAWTEVSKSSDLKPSKVAGEAVIQPITLKPPTPVIDLLPDFILQYATRARQEVPGSKYPAAEAIYEVLDGNLALRSPVNSYVKITYFPSEEEAKQDIEDTLAKRYTKNNEALLIGATVVKSGYTDREDSFFMGWTKQNYSIRINTSFTEYTPVQREDVLINHATPVAKAIVAGPDADNRTEARKSTGNQSGTDKAK